MSVFDPGASLPHVCLPRLLNRGSPKQRIGDWIFIIHHLHPLPPSPSSPHSCSHTYMYTHSSLGQPLIPKHPQNPGSLSFVFLCSNYLESPPTPSFQLLNSYLPTKTFLTGSSRKPQLFPFISSPPSITFPSLFCSSHTDMFALP